jgi:quinohemoprotein amine dehydrogenase beta subunit
MLISRARAAWRRCLQGAAAALALLGHQALAQPAHEYLLTVARPHHLHVVDMATNTLARSCELPARMGPGLMAPAPDGRTAYVLMDGWENIYGVDIATCKVVFTARQSHDDIRVKSFASLAVSPDGQELYTVQNPVRWFPDHAQVLEPRLAVYRTGDGTDAKPVRTFPVDRRITTIAATRTGKVILGGADVKQIDPRTGELQTLVPLQNWERPGWLTPDAFAMFNLGEQANEYLLPYVTARFTDASQSPEKAEWWWGMVRVDLATGKAEQMEFAPFEYVVFNFVTDATNKNTLYGVYNGLYKYDIAARKVVKTVEIDHSHYNLNVSGDGKRLYLGGTANDIAIYDTATLSKIGSIELPGGMGASDLRVARVAE